MIFVRAISAFLGFLLLLAALVVIAVVALCLFIYQGVERIRVGAGGYR